MHHMLLLLLLTASPAVIGYTLLLRQQDREGGFCVTDDYHRTVVFIPDISKRPTIPSAVINAQQTWTSEWQFENVYKKSNYWSEDQMWHDLGQISTYAGDDFSQPVNFDHSTNILPQQIFLSVLAKSVEVTLIFNVSVQNYNPYKKKIITKKYIMSVDAYDEASMKQGLRLKSCTWQDICTSEDFISTDFLENGTSWVHLEFTIRESNGQGIQIIVKKRGQDFDHLLHGSTYSYSSIQLMSASFKSNEGAAFLKLRQGHIMSQSPQSDFAVIIATIELRESKNICLDITWKYNLPSELHLEIKTQYRTIISRSYTSPSFEFDMKTRLSEYLQYSGSYNIILRFKSNGGVSNVSFCSNKKDAIQIIHTDDYLKGCQLLGKTGQNEPNAFESSCNKSHSYTPAEFMSDLPAICSKIEKEHHMYGFCDNYKVCDHLQCICIHKEASTLSQGTTKTEQRLSNSTPESTDQDSTQEFSKNASYVGTSYEKTCPGTKQLLTLLMVVLTCLSVVIIILTVMAVQRYKSLKKLNAAEDCTEQINFELQPIPGSSTNTIVHHNPHL